MQRRDLLKYTALAAVSGLPSLGRAAAEASDAGAIAVPDARLTAPLTVPASGEINVAFVLSEGAEVVDFTGPWGVFERVALGDDYRQPFRLYTVAATKAPVKVSGGMTVLPNYRFKDAPTPDVVVVPAFDTAKAPKALFAWLKAVQGKADLTMSVCDGAFALGEAGLLDGKSATAHHLGYGMLAMLYPKVNVVRGVRYVEDGKIATAGGLTSGTDLALRVVERYFGREVTEKTVTSLEYQGKGWMFPASNAVFAKRPVGTSQHPIDPVCEAQVGKNPELMSVYEGKPYYFCSAFCKGHFDAGPQRFLLPR